VVFNALGATQAAMWAVGSKMFSLAEPLMCRPYGAALPGFYEMNARGEIDKLQHRFRAIVLLTASWGAFLAASFVLCNNLFVHLWTSGKTVWSPVNDIGLGIWLFILSLQTTHRGFVNVTKQIGGMRYVLFLEGFTFLIVGMFAGSRWGVPGMVFTSIFCTLAYTYQYGIRRTCRYFHLPVKEVAFEWVRPSLKLALSLAILATVVYVSTSSLPVIWRFAIHALLMVTVGGWLFLRIGLPPDLIAEASRRLPSRAARILNGLVPARP